MLRTVAHPKLTLAVAAVVLAGCVAVALARLTLSSDQSKLFSHDVPFFRAHRSFVQKFPENEAIYIILEAAADNPALPAPPVPQWVALADQIAARLRSMPQYVKSVDYRVPLDQLGAQGILFQDPHQLAQTVEDARRFVPLVQLWAEKPGVLTGLLGSTPMERFITALSTQPPNPETAKFVKRLADSWVATIRSGDEPLRPGAQLPDLAGMDAADPSRLGYYHVPDDTDPSRHLMLVRVYPREDHSSLTAVSQTVDGIRGAVKDVARAFPQFRVGVTGRPALEADEMRTTDRDSHRSEIVALSVVFLGLVVMLRSVWLALVAELSLGVGIGWTFGWATISVGELNLLSIVFLIALIGIGMDYLVQILCAWRRESARYSRAKAVWSRVFRYVSPPISTACMGAAGAFLVAIFTDFRGAAQLGIIAGGGLLLCLLSGYTVLPALLTVWPAKVRKLHPSSRYGQKPPRLAGVRRLLLPALGLVLLLAAIPLMLRSHFSPNLLELQAPNLESVALVRKLQTWSAVVLSRDLDMLRQVRQSLEGAPTVARTESMLDAYDSYAWFQQPANKLPAIEWAAPPAVRPDDVGRIGPKAATLAMRFAISDRVVPAAGPTAATLDQFARSLADAPAQDRQRLARRLSLWQEGFIGELRQAMAHLAPPPPDVQKLPIEFRSHLISADGHYALYIHPSKDLWQQRELERFVHEVEQRVAAVPGNPGVTGIAVQVYHSTSAVAGSFYKATAYALGLIFVLVLLDLRRLRHTLLAISVLACGLPLLIAVMGLVGASWNFANFFGLPILIGAAHEYGVFLIHRYREAKHNPRRIWQRWDASDHALLLCAFITSSSFAFFWAMGHHEGLRSLGLVMAVGSACIYLSALLVLRPLLMWRLERCRRRSEAEQLVS